MIDKEFTEDIYDIEQEPLDLNISTFGKYFPAKSLEKVLGDSLYDNYFSENRISISKSIWALSLNTAPPPWYASATTN